MEEMKIILLMNTKKNVKIIISIHIKNTKNKNKHKNKNDGSFD